MASVVINGVQYADVPAVQIPKVGGGTATFHDTADADAIAADVLSGKDFYTSTGQATGSMANNGATGGTISTKAGTVTIPAGYTSGGTVSLSDVTDLISANVRSGKTILGVAGSMTAPTISQDSGTKVLSIS